jgi:hypothetical protein
MSSVSERRRVLHSVFCALCFKVESRAQLSKLEHSTRGEGACVVRAGAEITFLPRVSLLSRLGHSRERASKARGSERNHIHFDDFRKQKIPVGLFVGRRSGVKLAFFIVLHCPVSQAPDRLWRRAGATGTLSSRDRRAERQDFVKINRSTACTFYLGSD